MQDHRRHEGAGPTTTNTITTTTTTNTTTTTTTTTTINIIITTTIITTTTTLNKPGRRRACTNTWVSHLMVKHATHATQSHSQHRGLELLLRQVLERRVDALKIVRRDPKPLLTAKNAEPPSCRRIDLNEPD